MPSPPKVTTTINRILIQTHHITSRKKISHITKAAKRLSCSVLLKTGKSPGLMIAESISSSNTSSPSTSETKSEKRAEEWSEIVRVYFPPSATSSSLPWTT